MLIKRLNDYYLSKIQEKENGLDLINEFIEANLGPEEQALPLSEYIRLQATPKKAILESPQSSSKSIHLDLDTMILPLSFVEEIIDPRLHAEGIEHFKGLSSINFTFFEVLSNSRFPKHTFFLLKTSIYKNRIIYGTFLLNPAKDSVISYAIDHFFLEIMPEFLSMLTIPDLQQEAYSMRNFLFANATRYLITYMLEQEDDCQRIEAGLKSHNQDVKVSHLKNLKKSLLIKAGGKELKVKFLESKIEPIKNSRKFRTKSSITLKGDLDNYDAVIIKGIEPESGFCHYIYVTGHKDPEIKLMKRPDPSQKNAHRLSITSLFEKSHGEYIFHDRKLDNREPLPLNYTSIEEVRL